MSNIKPKELSQSMLSYGVRLIRNSSDLLSILGLILFALSVLSGLIDVDNEVVEQFKKIFEKLSSLILFFLLFRSGFKLWESEITKYTSPVFTLIPREKSLTLQNPSTIHPDSQVNIFFELNISNATGLDLTIRDIDIINLDPIKNFLAEKCRSRFVDLQNNHHEFHLPKMVLNGASEHLFIEFSYLPVPIKKEDVSHPTVPSHITEFAHKISSIQDFTAEVQITYLKNGEIHKKNIEFKIPFTLYKEHFLEKWSEYRWDIAVIIANKKDKKEL